MIEICVCVCSGAPCAFAIEGKHLHTYTLTKKKIKYVKMYFHHFTFPSEIFPNYLQLLLHASNLCLTLTKSTVVFFQKKKKKNTQKIMFINWSRPAILDRMYVDMSYTKTTTQQFFSFCFVFDFLLEYAQTTIFFCVVVYSDCFSFCVKENHIMKMVQNANTKQRKKYD